MNAPKALSNDRIQNMLIALSQCKTAYLKEKEECKRLREHNSKLENELKDVRESEKSHIYHVQTSREMIGNLQETVSQLVHLKRDSKKLKEELSARDASIALLQQEKATILTKHEEIMHENKAIHLKEMEDLQENNVKKLQQVQHDTDTQIAQFTCVIEELRASIRDLEETHRNKLNVIVLEYEEKLQRSSAQITQLQDQHAGLVARTDSNIDAYRRRLEELEEKLKQSQFKQYLAQTSLPSYESQVERPYSVNREPYDANFPELDPDIPKPRPLAPPAQTKIMKPINTLQVTYYGNKPSVVNNEKKGPFNITKKRKLYSEKDFQDF